MLEDVLDVLDAALLSLELEEEVPLLSEVVEAVFKDDALVEEAETVVLQDTVVGKPVTPLILQKDAAYLMADCWSSALPRTSQHRSIQP